MIPHLPALLRSIRALPLALLTLTLAIQALAQPTPAQLDRIAKLVEEGKTEAAKITVETLLEVHPGDAQLLAIQKLLAATPAAVPATPAPPPKPSLTPAERLEIDTVLDAARAAFQADDAARKSRLEALLRRPVPPVAETGGLDWLPYWQTRAAAALETSTWRAGWQAGRNLLRLDAINSTEPLLRRTLTSLNERGWLTETEAEVFDTATQSYAHWLGTWKGKINHREASAYEVEIRTLNTTLTIAAGNDLKPEIILHHNYSQSFTPRGPSSSYVHTVTTGTNEGSRRMIVRNQTINPDSITISFYYSDDKSQTERTITIERKSPHMASIADTPWGEVMGHQAMSLHKQ